MVVHILDLSSDSYQLTKNLIVSFVKLYKIDPRTDPFFLLVGKVSEERKAFFVKVFHDIGYNKYDFISLRNLLSQLSKRFDKKQPILLHGGRYSIMFILLCARMKNLNWVCWGSGTTINRISVRSILSAHIKKRIYHKYRSIITLMDDDNNSLQNNFGVRYVTTLPYYGRKDETILNQFKEHFAHQPRNAKRVVYLGNSGHYIAEYIEALEILRKKKGRIEVHCMLPYGLDGKGKQLRSLSSIGKEYYGEDFFMDYQYMDYSDYLKYMNKCNIYICGAKNQTGLGAIYASLALGKKIYLTGRNLNHIQSLGYTVYNIDTVEDSLEEPIPEKEMLKNHLIQMAAGEKMEKPWLDYLVWIQGE